MDTMINQMISSLEASNAPARAGRYALSCGERVGVKLGDKISELIDSIVDLLVK